MYNLAAKPDTDKVALPSTMFTVWVLPLTIIDTVPVALLFKVTVTVASWP